MSSPMKTRSVRQEGLVRTHRERLRRESLWDAAASLPWGAMVRRRERGHAGTGATRVVVFNISLALYFECLTKGGGGARGGGRTR